MKFTFVGRTVTCGSHTWDAGYPILEANDKAGCVCLILDYAAFPKWRQARNLRGYTTEGGLLWIAEHPSDDTVDCYTSFLDKERLRAEIAEHPTGSAARCFAGILDDSCFLAYNFAGYQCLVDPASGKLVRVLFSK
jgi:hypothetical protein